MRVSDKPHFYYMISKSSNIARISKALRKYDLKKETAKIVKNSTELRQILLDQMRLTEGIDKWEYSSGEYKEYKRNLASYIGKFPRVDLFNTGKFQRGIFAKTTGSNWFFTSRDSKTDELTSIYGEKIFDYNDENMTVAIGIVQRQHKKNITSIFKQ